MACSQRNEAGERDVLLRSPGWTWAKRYSCDLETSRWWCCQVCAVDCCICGRGRTWTQVSHILSDWSITQKGARTTFALFQERTDLTWSIPSPPGESSKQRILHGGRHVPPYWTGKVPSSLWAYLHCITRILREGHYQTHPSHPFLFAWPKPKNVVGKSLQWLFNHADEWWWQRSWEQLQGDTGGKSLWWHFWVWHVQAGTGGQNMLKSIPSWVCWGCQGDIALEREGLKPHSSHVAQPSSGSIWCWLQASVTPILGYLIAPVPYIGNPYLHNLGLWISLHGKSLKLRCHNT